MFPCPPLPVNRSSKHWKTLFNRHSCTASRRRMNLGIANDSILSNLPSRPASNWGLTRATTWPYQPRHGARQAKSTEGNETSHHHWQSSVPLKVSLFSIAEIKLLHADNPWSDAIWANWLVPTSWTAKTNLSTICNMTSVTSSSPNINRGCAIHWYVQKTRGLLVLDHLDWLEFFTLSFSSVSSWIFSPSKRSPLRTATTVQP